MDSMSRYLARASDPAIRSFNRRLRGIDEGAPGPARSNVTLDHIAAAEEALGVALPPSYRHLVLKAQPFDVEYGICWVWDIAVHGSDDGDEYCLDTRHPDDRGEYPIVHFNHGIHNEDITEFEVVARDLGEWLLGCLPRNPPDGS